MEKLLTALEFEEGELYEWNKITYRRKDGVIECQHDGEWSLSCNGVNERIYTKASKKKTYTYYRHWYLDEDGDKYFADWGGLNWETLLKGDINFTLLKTETMEIEA